MENVRKHRDIKLVTTNKRRLPSENLKGIEIKKTKVKMNKLIYLVFSISDLSKIVIYEFWYDYIKPKYGKKAKLYYMDTDSFIIHIKTN